MAGKICPLWILTGRERTLAREMYSKRWDYGQSTIILMFIEKPSPASLWTNLYLCCVGLGKGGGNQSIAHFGGSGLCLDVAESHYQGTKKTQVMIYNFIWDNPTCMAIPSFCGISTMIIFVEWFISLNMFIIYLNLFLCLKITFTTFFLHRVPFWQIWSSLPKLKWFTQHSFRVA